MEKDDYHRISDNPNIVFVFAMVAILITVFTVFANGVVITAVVYAHVQRKHHGQTNKVKRSTAAMLLMTSMSVVDFVVGLVVMPLYIPDLITNGLNLLDSSWSCVKYILNISLCAVSLYHVVVMATDRYLAVCRPLVYKALPLKVTWVMLALCWTLPTLIYLLFASIDAFSDLKSDNSTHPNIFCVHTLSLTTKILTAIVGNLPLAIIYILYIFILIEIYRINHKRKYFFGFQNKLPLKTDQKTKKININSLEECVDYPNSQSNKIPTNDTGKDVSSDLKSCNTGKDGEDVIRDGCKIGEYVQHKDINHETLRHRKSVIAPAGGSTSSLRAVKTIGEIVLCFSLYWLPFSVYFLVQSFLDIKLPMWLYLLLTQLSFLNSAINPVLLYNNLSIRTYVMLLIFPSTKIKK